MDKLSRISSGACETPSGDYGVRMHHIFGIRDNARWFEFKPTVLGPTIRIEWPLDTNIAVIDQSTAELAIRHGYAAHPSDEELEAYNAWIDEINDKQAASVSLLSQKPAIEPTAEDGDAEPSPDDGSGEPKSEPQSAEDGDGQEDAAPANEARPRGRKSTKSASEETTEDAKGE